VAAIGDKPFLSETTVFVADDSSGENVGNAVPDAFRDR